MKSSMWFETLMLAIILLASLVAVGLDSTANHSPSGIARQLQQPPERFASGR